MTQKDTILPYVEAHYLKQPVDQLALTLGVPPEAVENCICALTGTKERVKARRFYYYQYIQDHHQTLTVLEMSAETGLADYTLRTYFEELGIAPLTPRQKLLNYIKAHPGDTLEMISIATGKTINHLRKYYKELGISVPPVKKVPSKIAKPASEKKEKTTTKKKEKGEPALQPKDLEKCAAILANPGSYDETDVLMATMFMRSHKKENGLPSTHVKGRYTQSGSPYGLADELRDED